jgi:uncharacterized protein (TIRG00374 family)
VLIGAAVHWVLLQLADLKSSSQVLITMALWAVGLAFIAQVLSYLGSGFLLQSILASAHQKVTLWRSTLIVLGSYSIGMVAGGTVGSSAAIYRWTSEGEGNMEGATLASIFVPQFNNIILILISIYGLVHLNLTHKLNQAELIGFSAALLMLGLIIGIAALGVRFRNQAITAFLWLAERVAKLRRKPFDQNVTRQEADRLFGAWDLLRKSEWRRPIIGAFLNVAFDILTLYFLFVAAGENISLSVLLLGYGLPLLMGKVAFIIPGGVGVVESAMAVMYTELGVPQATAVIVVLAYRLISFWIPSLAGFPIAAYLERSTRRTPKSRVVHDHKE